MLIQIYTINAQEHSATIVVDYNYKTNFPSVGTEYRVNSRLIHKELESLFEIDHLNILNSVENDHSSKRQTFGILGKDNAFVYKNFLENEIFFKNSIEIKPFFIKGNLDNITWQIQPEKKNILNYNCQKATCEYKGRKYEAYFTSEIGVSDGPWHFEGLPGLILEVHSIDGIFSLTANSIKITKSHIEIKNPYKDKDLMNWNEFLALYKKKYDQVLRNGVSKNGVTKSLSKYGIMVYIKD